MRMQRPFAHGKVIDLDEVSFHLRFKRAHERKLTALRAYAAGWLCGVLGGLSSI